MTTKDHIIDEIRRTAVANGGKALGKGLFLEKTGIKESDWYGRYWTRWSEALAEAGHAPNRFGNPKLADDVLLRHIAELALQLGRFPSDGDIRMRTRKGDFPSPATLRRFGRRAGLVSAVRAYSQRSDMPQVVALCDDAASKLRPGGAVEGAAPRTVVEVGYVYLLRHGSRREFKIGRSNNPLRRLGEVRVELPSDLDPVHTIETDDPAGIEAYWHARFASKRLRGEWFQLDVRDVAAFKRWRKIH